MQAPRCANHKDREVLPAACHTCQRIKIEQDLVTRAVDALLAAGHELQVNDGEDIRPAKPTSNRDEILAELMQTDMDDLLTARGRYVVRFVYGNDGWDVINDYSVALEDILAPVNAYADTLV